MKMTRKLISIILSAICVCSLCVPAFAAELNERGHYIIGDKEYIDEYGVLNINNLGNFFYCLNTDRFFRAQDHMTECPCCGEPAYKASDLTAAFNIYDYCFKNADLVTISYTIFCPSCIGFIPGVNSYAELADAYNDENNSLWARRGFRCCRFCGAEITEDNFVFIVQWDFDTVVYSEGSRKANKAITQNDTIDAVMETRNFAIEKRAAFKAEQVTDEVISSENEPADENGKIEEPADESKPWWLKLINFVISVFSTITNLFKH